MHILAWFLPPFLPIIPTLLNAASQDLSTFNTLGLPARAQDFVRYRERDELEQLSALAARYPRVFVLGGGSNVVLPDRVPGLVVGVQSRGIRLVDESPEGWLVEAEAGENWHDFVQHSLRAGWPGLENLALIPGTVGAAPVQNIGAYGVELDQRFHSLLAWDIARKRMVEMHHADCCFSYRDSFFKHEPAGRWMIVAVRFFLHRCWAPVLGYPDLKRHPGLSQGITPQAVFDAVCEIRRSKLPDPAVLGNAGSFFKNPVVETAQHETLRQRYPDLVAYAQPDGAAWKLAAGWMIDRAGWKGRRMGPVGTHERQALVLVNHGGATAADVQRLAEAIKADVMEKFGVALEQEPVAVPA